MRTGPLSNSKNAVSFSSARTTKRFPSTRCASAIQIVRPLESIAETQPQLQPGFTEIGSDDFQIFHLKWNGRCFGFMRDLISNVLPFCWLITAATLGTVCPLQQLHRRGFRQSTPSI